jgi:hypothetical protein
MQTSNAPLYCIASMALGAVAAILASEHDILSKCRTAGLYQLGGQVILCRVIPQPAAPLPSTPKRSST